MISEKEYDNIQIGDSIVIDIDGGPIFQVIGHSSIGLIWTLADPICSKLSAFPILEGSIVDNNKFGGKYGYRFDRNEILEVRKFVPISSPPVVEKIVEHKESISADGKWISNISKYQKENPPESPFRWL